LSGNGGKNLTSMCSRHGQVAIHENGCRIDPHSFPKTHAIPHDKTFSETLSQAGGSNKGEAVGSLLAR
jgi:hypothetical protein